MDRLRAAPISPVMFGKIPDNKKTQTIILINCSNSSALQVATYLFLPHKLPRIVEYALEKIKAGSNAISI